MDGFRRAHKLYKAEDTRRWMERYGMTHKQLEYYVADEAIIVKLRDRITAGRIEDTLKRIGLILRRRGSHGSSLAIRIAPLAPSIGSEPAKRTFTRWRSAISCLERRVRKLRRTRYSQLSDAARNPLNWRHPCSPPCQARC